MTGKEAEAINKRYQEKMRRLRGGRKPLELKPEEALPIGDLDYEEYEQEGK